MSEDKAAHTEEQQSKPRRLRPWRPTRRQVLWAVGTLLALVTIALLVVNRDAVKWEDLLTRERIEQVALFIGIAVALTTLIVLLAIGGASLGWTGFADKTLWEWLQLLGALAIPLVLAIAGFWFTTQQEARQQRIETQRAQEAQKIEQKRAQAERRLAEQRAQDEALQAYLDQIGSLLLHDGLLNSENNSNVQMLARARTLTVLQTLDSDRRGSVMKVLIETNLVEGMDGEAPIVSLAGARLSDMFLPGAPLSGADLRQANLRRSDLRLIDLSSADLWDAYLTDADLSAADLTGADLTEADLTNANLTNADLSDANLTGADLRDANLLQADLTGAEGVTNEELEQQADSLEGATMPNGQQYEDWLKGREKRQQDE